MSTADRTTTVCEDSSEFIPISVDALRALIDFLNVDLYMKQPGRRTLVLYRKRTHPVTQTDLDRLASRGIDTLYLTVGDRDACCQAVMSDSSDMNGWVEPARRCKVLRDISQAAFNTIFHGGTFDDVLRFANELGPRMIGAVCRKDLVVRDLLAMQDHDDGIYTHSVNVMACSVLLAGGLGMTSADELASLAVGALLHDLGKRHVLLETLKRPGPLNSRQRKEIQNHPTRGFRELVDRDDLGWEQLMMVYQHHERVDGTGYPVGLLGEEINPWARICAVADVFCALTSRTPSHKASTVEEALETLDEEAGTSLDGEMVKCWKAIVGADPRSSTS